MKVIGQIILSKTPGRQDSWVKKKVKNDYFLSLKINQIGDHQIKKTQDTFSALKNFFPQITADNQLLNDLFVKVSLPPNVEDISHITLGNFPDFRVDRNVENDIDMEKVAAAQSLNNEIAEFEINQNDFELVATCNTEKVTLSAGTITKAPTVGFNRDAVLNIKPSPEIHEKLNAYSKKVFGNSYVLWNSQQQPVPYHITIAQTNQLGKTLANLEQSTESKLVIKM